MDEIEIRELYAAFVLAWTKETAKGRWSELCPDMNQCCSTALVVQDYMGGDLLRCMMTNGAKHFWNRLDDGREIDFTRAQFDFLGVYPVRTGRVKANRKSLLRVKQVKRRYELLRERVETELMNGRANG